MASFYSAITDEQAGLIEDARLFFVGTADPDLRDGPTSAGPVNVSPKGGVPLHIIDRNRVAYLDYTGSGNETARHSIAGGPITVMVCAFEHEDIVLPGRQVIDVHVDRTATSCGYGVPVMFFEKQRTVAERGRRYKESKVAP